VNASYDSLNYANELRTRYLRLLMCPCRRDLAWLQLPSALVRCAFHSSLMINDSTQVTKRVPIEEVYAAVTGAASQDPKELSVSAARLRDLIDQPGTLDLLQQIAAQRTAPLHIRQLSIIQVKNVVSTHWRSRRSEGHALCLFW
jgi:Importin-beta N-terminal domain